MTPAPRAILAFILLAASLALAAPGLLGLPDFGNYPGPYGDIINANGTKERHITNMVTAVTFDYRGLDTLGEEFILFAAVTGGVLLLRGHRGEETRAEPASLPGRPPPERSPAVMLGARIIVGIVLLFGIYVVLHAQITPGGGFQGGAIIGSAAMLLYLGAGYRVWRRLVRSTPFTVAESLATGAFVLAGLAPMLVGAPFLDNLLPLGTAGKLVSGGVLPLINIAVAIAVASGLALLFLEFLEETRAVKRGDDEE